MSCQVAAIQRCPVKGVGCVLEKFHCTLLQYFVMSMAGRERQSRYAVPF